MPNAIIFLVGTFVTLVWGSVVGVLIYAAIKPMDESKEDKVTPPAGAPAKPL